MANRYVVRAICTGTINERWMVTSERPLTREEVTDAVEGGERPDGVTVDCTEEEVSEEENRQITDVEIDEGAFAPEEEEVSRG